MNGSHSQFVHDICVLTNKSWFHQKHFEDGAQPQNPAAHLADDIKGYKGKVVWKVLIWSWFGCVLWKWQTSGMWPLIKNTLNSHILTYELSNVLLLDGIFLWYSPLHTNMKQCKQLLVNEIHFHFQLHCSSGVMLREVTVSHGVCNHYYSDLSHSVQSEQQSLNPIIMPHAHLLHHDALT